MRVSFARARALRAPLVLLLLLGSSAEAQGLGSLLVNVSPAFRPGPYANLKVNPADPRRVAIGTPDGYILWSTDAGATSQEHRALNPRQYLISPIRAEGARRREYYTQKAPRGAIRLFLHLLRSKMPTGRMAYWMNIDDPSIEIADIALPSDDSAMAIASPSGIWISDAHRGAWTRTVGTPRVKGKDIQGTSIVIDPADSHHMLAGTSNGTMVSYNGGHTFLPHPDSKIAGEMVRRFLWEPGEPKKVFALTEDTIYVSVDRGETFTTGENSEDIRTIALSGDGGYYVATGKGLLIASAAGRAQILFKDEPVVGVVPLGGGYALAATDQKLTLISATGPERVLMQTEPSDPFVAVEGTSELIWILTKYGVFRFGAQESRSLFTSPQPPKLNMTLAEVERAVMKKIKLESPSEMRFYDRWYAKLLPQVSFRIKGVYGTDFTSANNPFIYPAGPYQAESGFRESCCGTVPGDSAANYLIIARWNLASIIFGHLGTSNPQGLLESSLSGVRDAILTEVRWRYREAVNLVQLLAHPPAETKVAVMWQLRLEEYASYLQAISGKEVIAMRRMEE